MDGRDERKTAKKPEEEGETNCDLYLDTLRGKRKRSSSSSSSREGGSDEEEKEGRRN